MENLKRKGNTVEPLPEGYENVLDGWVMLPDTWVNETDTLEDENGNSYNILDYDIYEYEESNTFIPIFDMKYVPKPIVRKKALVKLDKPVKIGEVLYVKDNEWTTENHLGAVYIKSKS